MLEFEDKVNTKVLDKVKTRASNRVDITKKPDCRNNIIAWLNDKANSSKRPVFLDRVVVGVLDKKNISASNRVDMR